jgi:hypothetical protein
MNKLIAFAIVMGIIVALSFILSLPFMWLWNASMPDVFGIKEITWFQSWCFVLLAGFLNGSTRMHLKQ